MTQKRIGASTIRFEDPPYITGFAAVGGKSESDGPLGKQFDLTNQDTMFGETSWEKAESQMQLAAVELALKKAALQKSDIRFAFAGDLLNQCISSSFSMRGSNIPLFGIYGACSTMAEGLSLAAMAIDGGFAEHTLNLTSSHFCSAERQYRFPLEYGSQRTPSSQWTATAAGATVLSKSGNREPRVTRAVTGKIIDLGIKDASHMGAAMTPAAYDTLSAYFKDTGETAQSFDLIVTGDLGFHGRDLLVELFLRDGFDLGSVYNDCGCMIYDPIKQKDTEGGGSGCGCSAAVLCSDILPRLCRRELHRVLFAGTGALLSPTSTLQKESVPGICHAVVIEV